jgi:hypothetical protein
MPRLGEGAAAQQRGKSAILTSVTRPGPARWDAFGIVRDLARVWPDVEAATKYDGSPLLKCHRCFMAGMALPPAAEPDTLVVRIDPEARQWLLDEAADTYYLTAYHAPHPVVLVRLARIDREALRDLLAMARRATLRKAGRSAG